MNRREDSTPRSELVELCRLAAPLSLVHLGQTLLGAVDTAIVGRLGTHELGATGLGNSLFFLFAIVGLGAGLGLDPLISQAVGAREQGRARLLFWQGMWIALIVGVPLTALAAGAAANVDLVGIRGATAPLLFDYVLSRLPGLVPFVAFGAARSYLQAHGATRPLVVGVVVANVVNLVLAWALVFGDAGLVRVGLPALGVPALGVVGAGGASAFATLIQLAISLLGVRAVDEQAPPRARALDIAVVGRILRLGAPIAAALLIEVGVFSIANYLMALVGPDALAGHQVALTLAALTFMVPIAIGSAASVRVGHQIGRGDTPRARRAGFASLGLGLAFMSTTALAFFAMPRPLARLITDQPAAVAAAVPLVLIAAVFQLADGAQAVAAGALRGAGDTKVALFANLIGHYAIGLPVSITLAFVFDRGATGLWWGLCVGLFVVAIWLTTRFVLLTRRDVARV